VPTGTHLLVYHDENLNNETSGSSSTVLLATGSRRSAWAVCPEAQTHSANLRPRAQAVGIL
jgi:hypothetical protein